MKKCTKCLVEKELSDFAIRNEINGHKSICKECDNAMSRARNYKVSVSEKKCTKCGELKAADEFKKDRRNSTGLSGLCRECSKAKNKEYRSRLAKRENPIKPGEKLKCSACGELKDATEFHKDRGNTRGVRSTCKQCVLLYHKTKGKANANARTAKRRSLKLQATPEWLTEEQLSDIRAYYRVADKLSEVTGKKYHVDHIHPLQGKNVCGLHVPWNLQILEASANISKSNRYIPDTKYTNKQTEYTPSAKGVSPLAIKGQVV